MNNKAQSKFGVIAIVIFLVVVFLVVTITVFILINQKGNNSQINFKNITIYINAIDENNQISADYLIISNTTEVASGILTSDSLTQIDVPDKDLKIYCSKEGYYTDIISKTFSSQEQLENSSRITCNPKKASEIIIDYHANFKTSIDSGNVQFEILGDNFHQLSGVILWTPAIINVESQIWSKPCEAWIKKDGLYYCEDKPYECSEFDGSNCLLKETIPNRYSKADSAFMTGQDLTNLNMTLDFQILTTGNIKTTDCITFIFYDKDLRWNGKLEYLSELNGDNIGNSKDFPIKICPNE